jgi:hypothetical protein
MNFPSTQLQECEIIQQKDIRNSIVIIKGGLQEMKLRYSIFDFSIQIIKPTMVLTDCKLCNDLYASAQEICK